MSYRRFLKPGRLILGLLSIVILYKGYATLFGEFVFSEKVVIEKGDTMASFLQPLSTIDQIRVKLYIRQHPDALEALQLGSYTFSGTYTPSSLISIINKWPQQSYLKLTLLEGWSMYDIDAALYKQWLIKQGEYIVAASDSVRIQELSKKYPFIADFVSSKPVSSSSPITLEGLLYPDTYHVNPNQPVVDQLLSLQLAAFRDKVVKPYQGQITAFSDTLRAADYEFSLGWYNIITLASIIEKEERNSANKPVIASLFLNRIQLGMRLDADITLCYGLRQWYESCTPDIIARSITDSTNNYNTRVHSGLTPTPISNPSVSTISALLSFKKTSYLFYLHDAQGQIWYAEDIQWHNNNKSKYL